MRASTRFGRSEHAPAPAERRRPELMNSTSATRPVDQERASEPWWATSTTPRPSRAPQGARVPIAWARRPLRARPSCAPAGRRRHECATRGCRLRGSSAVPPERDTGRRGPRPLEGRRPAGTGTAAVPTTPAQPRRSRPSGRLHVRVSQPTIHGTAAGAPRTPDGYAGAMDPCRAHPRCNRCVICRSGRAGPRGGRAAAPRGRKRKPASPYDRAITTARGRRGSKPERSARTCVPRSGRTARTSPCRAP